MALLRCAAARGCLPAGPLRRADLRRLSPNGADRVARLALTGRDLVRVLEAGARDAYYLLTTSGARVVYDAARPAGARVVEVRIGGAPLDPGRRYTVACSEYLAQGGTAFGLLHGTPHEVLPWTVDQALAEHLAAAGTVRPVLDGRLVLRGSLPTTPPARG